MRYLSDTVVNLLMSDAGVAYLKYLEGLSLTPYADGNGNSIGYGHFIEPGEEWMLNGITQAQAESIFATDVQTAEDEVNNTITAGLTQPEFDALCMFAYNIGAGNFASSQLAKNINAGQSAEQIYNFWLRTWVGSPASTELLARRQKEAGFAFPDTTASTSKANYWWLLLPAVGVYLYSKS